MILAGNIMGEWLFFRKSSFAAGNRKISRSKTETPTIGTILAGTFTGSS